MQVAYGVGDRTDLFLRLGGGVPFFLMDGSFSRQATGFPLGMWPDLSAGVKIGLR